MLVFDRILQLVERIQGYPWWQVAIELALIAALVTVVVRFVQGTRAAGALKGLFVVIIVGTLVVRIIGQREVFQRLTFLYDNFLTIAAVGLIVIFQPELRRGLTRLGETPIFRRQPQQVARVVEAIRDASVFLSKARFGALIVIERDVPLKGITEGGTDLNALVSAPLLQTLFFPGTALHDLATVVSGETVIAAGVQLPLAEPELMPDPSLGSRHRAAVGVSRECDAVVVVVSEETGSIRVAERGRLSRPLSAEDLSNLLTKRLEGRTAERSSRLRRLFRSGRPGSGPTVTDEPAHAADLNGTDTSGLSSEPMGDSASGGLRGPSHA
ncbi:MAG: diadenylate cyclase CdaA [Phycisphaerales bacterium]